MNFHAELLKRAAEHMREDHPKNEHKRWVMWDRMAMWLDCTAIEFEQERSVPAPSVPISVADAYERARESV